MLLSEEQLLIQQTIRTLAEKAIRPFSQKWAKEKIFPKEALEALGQAGFLGMLIPEEWNGTNIDHVTYTLVIAEIAKADGAISTIASVHNSVATLPILKFGTPEQKAQFLRPMAQGKKLGAFCLSEPQAGSDAANLQTKAVREGDEYVLNGVKQFVTSGQHADIAIVFAVTDPQQKQQGITAFIVPTQTKGYHVAKLEHKMGQHASEIAQIVFEDCRIPVEYQLGQLGEGYKIALSNLECGRLGIAAQSIGMAEEALQLSLQYAKERKTFGKFLYEHQAIHFKLADMATQLEAAKQLLLHAAKRRDQYLPSLKEASMAKLFASEVAEKICREAMQIYGGYGYLEDFPLERIYRDVRVTSIYEGTSDIQRIIIGRELLKE
ncbi:MAG: acyl-CoA dehydrogenase [Gammaproteobacteria bacterium 39-13]|nr:acyl-CoA dehydrogenase family protein [Gammaproteobacteria bacterium]OJV87915.1 MAG: acyl-CoA dehydrogenase [Gammaproteobacteria bacterium 39-13]